MSCRPRWKISGTEARGLTITVVTAGCPSPAVPVTRKTRTLVAAAARLTCSPATRIMLTRFAPSRLNMTGSWPPAPRPTMPLQGWKISPTEMPAIPVCSAEAEPLSAQEACRALQQCAELQVSGGSVFWLASEPEAGGTALWWYSRQGSRRLDTGGSVRSRLNSYGGGAYAVMDGVVCWISEDQYLWVMDLDRSEEHTSELQSRPHLVCRLLL